jgi:hypothetical protein
MHCTFTQISTGNIRTSDIFVKPDQNLSLLATVTKISGLLNDIILVSTYNVGEDRRHVQE